ncbi:MAG: PAS domain-containing protein, partial [Coriobacteriia bacterium]|nr:PAS domain-containing protein [Coriobacteriia bacterium]
MRDVRDTVPQSVRVVGVYVALSLTWILLSDAAVGAFVSDPAHAQLVNTVKGWAYVAVVAIVLFGILRADEARLKKADGERARAEARMARMLEAVPSPVIFLDADGAVTYANRAAELVTGMSAHDLRGVPLGSREWRFRDINGMPVLDDDLPPYKALRTGIMASDEVVSFERGDGARVWISVDTVRPLAADGLGDGLLVTFADVTDKIAPQRRLERLNRLYSVLGEVSRLVVALPGAPDILQDV